MTSGVLAELAQYWDAVVAAWMEGAPAVPSELQEWFDGYQGKGANAVDLNALPEPWHGPLDPQQAQIVFLALNPGKVDPDFQYRHGIFPQEMREEYAGYSDWAASWPYLRDPWKSAKKKPNPHHRKRLTFARRWFDDASLPASGMVSFEMYPWHSTGLNAVLKPDPGIVREYVWKPVAALGVPVFAFGKDWFKLLEDMGLRVIDRLGLGGRDYGSKVATRAVHVFEAAGGIQVIAAKHHAYPGPPSESETILLREAIG